MLVHKIGGELSLFAVTALMDLQVEGHRTLQIGSAVLPAGRRHPETGRGAHDGIEISLVVEGVLDVETADCTTRVQAGDVLMIPRGEAHASTAIEGSRVFYVLLS